MLNKVCAMVRRYDMIHPGDRVICAVSGGADSMALLWSMVLLREKLGFSLEAAHFNHNLRGQESARDEGFVREFCEGYGIPAHFGTGKVEPGKKGLEAAAREARYAFLRGLGGVVATAHTADDNAETVLMRLIRGTGLKGLGAIPPTGEGLIRPMLTVTRQEVLAFLEEYGIPYVEDSTNAGDAFLRNRLRHHVMPLLKAENPSLAGNLSEMALRLREDEAALAHGAEQTGESVCALRGAESAVRRRVLERFLKKSGVKEPEASHIRQLEALVWTDKPSAVSDFPGGVRIARDYDRLVAAEATPAWEHRTLPCPGTVEIPQIGLRITCAAADAIVNDPMTMTLRAEGELVLRPRQSGDRITLPGGTKSLKKLMIDRKIPAARRGSMPVLADEAGILGVCGIGADETRKADRLPAVTVRFEPVGTY